MKPFRYAAGIERAEAEGRIVRGPTIEDLHAIETPAGSVSHFNTRSMEPLALDLLHYSSSRETLRVLLLGSGSGSEAHDIRHAIPEARVDGVALTPANPYARLMLSHQEIHRRVLLLLGADVLHARRMETTYGRSHEAQKQRYLKMTPAELEVRRRMLAGADPGVGNDTHVPTSLLEELQESGVLSVFETTGKPSLDRQYVGLFPGNITPEGRYDFVYENRGPLFHGDTAVRGTADDSAVKACNLLSDDGLLYAEQVTPYDRANAVADFSFGKSDDGTLVLQDQALRLIVVRGGHPLNAPVRQALLRAGSASTGGVAFLRGDAKSFLAALLAEGRR